MRLRALLIDLDMTLVDSSPLEALRTRRAWSDVYSRLHECSVYGGIANVMAAVESMDASLQPAFGVVTSSPRVYAERLLTSARLAIPVVVAYHDTTRRKPHPDPLLEAVRRLGCDPCEAVYVGDAPMDIVAARAAGMTSVAAVWGCASREALLAEQPHVVASTPEQLADWVTSQAARAGRL